MNWNHLAFQSFFFVIRNNAYFTASVAQSRERWTSELTGSESRVRAALGARCLLLTGMVIGQRSGQRAY